MTLSIMILSIMTLSIMTLSIMTLSIMTFSITTLSIECNLLCYAVMQNHYTECRGALDTTHSITTLSIVAD